MQVAEKTVLPAAEREERDRSGDADVDPDHAGLHLVPVATDRCAGLGEDRRAVAEAARVDDLNRLVERLGMDDGEDGSEDLLLHDLHVRVGAGENRRAQERAFGIDPVSRDATAVEHELGAIGHGAFHVAGDAVTRIAGDHRSELDLLVEPVTDAQRGAACVSGSISCP